MTPNKLNKQIDYDNLEKKLYLISVNQSNDFLY
jgi:hypothetical protein